MAQLLQLCLLASSLFALSFKATSSSSSGDGHGLESLHFALYQHETINKTGIHHSEWPGGSRRWGKPQHPSAPFDGLRSISIAKITLRLKNRKGSISIVGGTHNIKPADHPVVGGTGDFMFVQGYVTSSPVDLKGTHRHLQDRLPPLLASICEKILLA
ncbi:DIRIGENT PROTEIN [Salix viminalis]|uniref:Dirigent protein n=1 Tax=Salix viminalis TaxID=40686 RepID=A0A9Q0UVF1_SALVM|nr:DIRIGENT PROTEIN [Salix viminalis]